MAYNHSSGETTKAIIEIVNNWESSDKSDFIEDVMNMLTEDQRVEILCLIKTNAQLMQSV